MSVLETDVSDVTSVIRPARSNPLNMPEEGVPVLIESGSASSFEQSPRLLDREMPGCSGENQLREDLADAMLESPGRTREEGMYDLPHPYVPVRSEWSFYFEWARLSFSNHTTLVFNTFFTH